MQRTADYLIEGQPAPELIVGARDCIMANMKERLAELEGEQ